MARGQDGVEVMSRIDEVLVTKAMLCYVHDVRAVKEKCFSEQHAVLCKIRLVAVWIRERWSMGQGELEVRN